MEKTAFAKLNEFAAPAKARNEVWRTLVGIFLIGLLYVGPFILLLIMIALVWPGEAASLGEEMLRANTPRGTLLMIYSFVFLAGSVLLTVRFLHRRPALSLLGPFHATGRDFARVLLFVGCAHAILMLVPAGPAELVSNLDFSRWLSLLPLTLVGLLIQTSAEELVFRGYLQQQLAARFRSPVVWMVLPAIFFGALHYAPEEMGGNALIVAAWAALFGLAAADLTARAGNLGPAIAFHFANNITAIGFVSLQGPLSGLALYHLPFAGNDTEVLPQLLWLELVVLIVTWAIARYSVKR